MSELQTQVRELRLHALRVPGSEKLVAALACDKCGGKGEIWDITGTATCPDCYGSGAWYCDKLGAVTGTIEEHMPEGWEISYYPTIKKLELVRLRDGKGFVFESSAWGNRDFATVAAAKRCMDEMEKVKA